MAGQADINIALVKRFYRYLADDDRDGAYAPSSSGQPSSARFWTQDTT